MAIRLKKQDASSVPTPSGSYVSFFVDETGTPSLKDSLGAVSPSVTVDGSPLALDVQATPPTAVPGTVKLYSKTMGSIAEFFVQDDLGQEVQVTRNGALVRSGPLQITTVPFSITTTGSYVVVPAPPPGVVRVPFCIQPLAFGVGTTNGAISFRYKLGAQVVSTTKSFLSGIVLFEPSVNLHPTEALTLEVLTFSGSLFSGSCSYVDYPTSSSTPIRLSLTASNVTLIPSPAAGKSNQPYTPIFPGLEFFFALSSSGFFVENLDTISHTVVTEYVDGVNIAPISSTGSISPGSNTSVTGYPTFQAPYLVRVRLVEPVATTSPILLGQYQTL